MNLITEPWIQAICGDGSRARIAPWRMSDPAFVDISAPRPDFRGALFQFLIGLLQSVCPPETSEDWAKWWETPPPPETLKAQLRMVSDAFELDRDGSAFMQDYDQLESSKAVPISYLLIDSPSDNTLKVNADFFIKRSGIQHICEHCAAAALFTLQINATGSGRGYHTSVRGWGPLTTLLVPDDMEAHSKLWHKLWLNILPTEDSELTPLPKSNLSSVFPWCDPTRSSEKGQATYPEDAHPCQVYWSMPRRIRLDFTTKDEGNCGLCGEYTEKLVERFRRKQYGVNYQGAWIHPLSPYQLDPKNVNPPKAIHGQKDGITYRHWLGLFLGDTYLNQDPALNVTHYIESKIDVANDLPHEIRIWSFGYDMDSQKIAKARSWCESIMPIYQFPRRQRDRLKMTIADLLSVADDLSEKLKNAIKKVWIGRIESTNKKRIVIPKEHKKVDVFFIGTLFWQNTEPLFYKTIRKTIEFSEKNENMSDLARHWVSGLRREALDLFDQWALSGPVEDLDMKRVFLARRELQKWMTAGKKVKKLLGDRKPTAA